MVNILRLISLLIVVQEVPSTFQEMFPRTPPPAIAAVRKVTESDTVLKPCHPVTVVFEVRLAEEAVRAQWVKVARSVSRLVGVNGREYRNMLSEGTTNTACEFKVLWPRSVGREPAPRALETGQISATCQFDLKKRSCLFEHPGDYRLEFYFDDRVLVVTVRVLAPTAAERAIIHELNTVPMLLLLADPTDRQYATPENIATLENLLAVPSDYSKMLSLTLGLAKRQRVGRPLWSDLTDEQRRKELEERFALLTPVLEDDLDTRLEGLAGGELLHVATQLARLVREPEQRAAFAQAEERILPKLASCGLVPRQQALAKAVLLQRGGRTE